jgi:hypothetical protein
MPLFLGDGAPRRQTPENGSAAEPLTARQVPVLGNLQHARDCPAEDIAICTCGALIRLVLGAADAA